MDQAEAKGLGLAIVAHGALLFALGLAGTRIPPVANQPIEVSFVDEVGLVSTSPSAAVEPPAPSTAPELGIPEDAALQPPEPLPAPSPLPRAKADPTPAKARPNPQPTPPTKAAPRGSKLGEDILKGIGRDPSGSRSEQPTGAVLGPESLASIQQAIKRQIQPCADRAPNPGPGANRIVVTLNLRLREDGSLAAATIVDGRTRGVTDDNRRYEQRVEELILAATRQCSPLRNLPAEYYRTARGGWSNINVNYNLP